MNSSIKMAALVAGSALTIGVGFGGVTALASDNGTNAQEQETVSAMTGPPRAATITGTLKNGKTIGYWAPTTPDDQRPDYMPVDLEGGKQGYLKVNEAYPPIDPKQFESSDAGRKLRAKYMATKIQPDKNGDVWAPAYADDGTTVIGRVLISIVDADFE